MRLEFGLPLDDESLEKLEKLLEDQKVRSIQERFDDWTLKKNRSVRWKEPKKLSTDPSRQEALFRF